MEQYLQREVKKCLKDYNLDHCTYRCYIEKNQWKLQNKTSSEQLSKILKSDSGRLKWKGIVADLVELTYGIMETKKVDRDDIDISDFIDKLCTFFSVVVKDCYDTFRAIRRRVGSRTPEPAILILTNKRAHIT